MNLYEFKRLSPEEQYERYYELFGDDQLSYWRSLKEPNGHYEDSSVDAATWLLEQEATVEALWGNEHRCIWSKGEPFYLFASPGMGKTTLIQRLALRRSGVHGGDLLGLPVEVDERRLLYIAADRPRQAQRSMSRMVSESDAKALREAMVVWPQGLPFTISSAPEELLPWVEGFGEIGTVVVDSFFDVAPSLSDEEGSALANNAMQNLVRAGIEVIVLHHDRKRDSHSRGKVTQDDMYGGRPISKGAGSIAFLDGEPNTLRCTFRLLKCPAGPVSPIDLRLYPATGEVELDELGEY